MPFPTCVRHSKPGKDVLLRHFYLCNGCAETWTKDAFGGNASLHDGERLRGYCLLCNRAKVAVRQRTWFLCTICHRVAGSIGRSHVAEKAVLDFWAEHVRPRFPSLKLIQQDRASLRPRSPDARAGIAPLDFIVIDTKSKRKVFGIENKTGRSAIREMSQFQLDTSDCDCLLNEMKTLRIPAFVFHAQVLELWDPPTAGFQCKGLWWTDAYTLASHFKSVRQRGDERRTAAYFNRKAFSDISTFADSLTSRNRFTLVEKFKKKGVPRLYRG